MGPPPSFYTASFQVAHLWAAWVSERSGGPVSIKCGLLNLCLFVVQLLVVYFEYASHFCGTGNSLLCRRTFLGSSGPRRSFRHPKTSSDLKWSMFRAWLCLVRLKHCQNFGKNESGKAFFTTTHVTPICAPSAPTQPFITPPTLPNPSMGVAEHCAQSAGRYLNEN